MDNESTVGHFLKKVALLLAHFKKREILGSLLVPHR